ncbi:MAG: hypothetical protein GW903_05525 [Alphaproteobacteria bacterium]|nr:hypothetical protein [Alphaproteobacteria bacterium]NCQ88950.1 hypothetical protein [Alphaproteobacteria bacterium]NCT07852.1 hypothetical protein [Alphaproteobacteria bacterium]
MCKKQIANDNIKIGQYQLPKTRIQELCIFEIKQLADKEATYKAQCLQAIKEYKQWQKAIAQETDLIELLYGTMEGKIHHDKMKNMIQLYWAIRKHFRSAFTSYINQTKIYTPPIRMAA